MTVIHKKKYQAPYLEHNWLRELSLGKTNKVTPEEVHAQHIPRTAPKRVLREMMFNK